MVLQTIVIQRDYSRGTLTRFDETYPADLQGKVTPEEYKGTIDQINDYFLEAETIDFSTFLDGCLGCLSLFSIFLNGANLQYL